MLELLNKQQQEVTPNPPLYSLSVAPLAILGGFLTHLTLGTLYCWGNFQSYLPPSMKYFAGLAGAGTPDSLYVIPLGMVFMCIGMPISSFFQAKLGLPLSMLFGSLLMAGGVYLSSFATTLASFMLTYAVMFGFGVGLAYTAPIVAGWKHFPDRRGLVSGCILGGFSVEETAEQAGYISIMCECNNDYTSGGETDWCAFVNEPPACQDALKHMFAMGTCYMNHRQPTRMKMPPLRRPMPRGT
ncbi:hypothetical protein TrLO_g1607 [Triparma laevis f. longispina]|uniref:Uncharacterized protein n=1 Tax=Triparma laevis f. longispina TaxID=1714387 RepID=A0A9W7AHV6_9STRA|nr:hypothetical protein TrLO_g1607 [Triparma laevis f. longispina]